MIHDYFVGDTRPYWKPTVEVDGAFDDMTTGYTFEVNLAQSATSTPVLIKTTNIVGGLAGLVTVAWVTGDLAKPVDIYVAQLTATRTSDGKEWTIEDRLRIKPRLT